MNDSPWLTGRMVGIKAGERLAVNDPLHRTKGAKHAKGQNGSARPKGWAPSGAEVATVGARMNSRQRYKARRQARIAAEVANGVRTKTAPALKTGPNYGPVATTLQVEYADIRHEAMGPQEDLAHHLKTATPLKGCS